MAVTWSIRPLGNDPFDFVVGGEVEHRVHYAQSNSTTDNDVRATLKDVVTKTVSMAATNVRSATDVLLFHLDTSDGTVRCIYCDSFFLNDSIDVVICEFRNIDRRLSELFAPHLKEDNLDDTKWKAAVRQEGARMKRVLIDVILHADLTMLDPQLQIVFSDAWREGTKGIFLKEIIRGEDGVFSISASR